MLSDPMLSVMRPWSVALIIGLLASASALAQSETSSPGSARQTELRPTPPALGAVAPPPTEIRARESGVPAARSARPGRLNDGFDESPSFDRMRSGAGDSVMPRPGVDLFRAAPDPARSGRGASSGILIGVPVYAVPYGPYPYGPFAPGDRPSPAAVAASAERVAARGFLRLLVNPRSAAVVIDGVYEGTADDFGGSSERAIPAGPHRVQLEADGYEPVGFDVRVPDNDTIILRRDLEPRAEAPAVAVAAAPFETPVATPLAPPGPPTVKKTIYLIPRCYLGDTRPQPEQLPAGCRLADLQTLP